MRAFAVVLGFGLLAAVLCSTVPSALVPEKPSANATLLQASPAGAVTSNLTAPLNNGINVLKVYFINLDERSERKEAMEAQLTKQGMSYARKPAIRVADLVDARNHDPFRLALQQTPIDSQLSLDNEGFVTSVYLSHVTLYRDIQKEWQGKAGPNDAVLVLEDDAIIRDDWKQRLQKLSKSVPSDWEVLRIGHWGEMRAEDFVNADVARARQPFYESESLPEGEKHHVWYGGAHAVLLRLSKLDKSIDSITSIPMIDIDSVLTHCCDRVKSYVLAENLVDVNYSFESDNHARVPLPPS